VAARSCSEGPRVSARPPSSTAQLLEVHASDLGAAARNRVLDEAAGNPLALVELPRALESAPDTNTRLLSPFMPLTHRLQRRFRHPLVRSAVYQSAPLTQRHTVHRALAEVLVNEPDRRARHRAASIVGTDEGVASELEAAARRAQRRGATASAIVAQRRVPSWRKSVPPL
jgi:hypothetical protein